MKRSWLISLAALAVILPVGFFAGTRKVNADYNEDGTVTIDETNFPDKDFRDIVSIYDYDKDGYLSSDEIAKVKELIVDSGHSSFSGNDEYVNDITGIEYFTELTHLTIHGNLHASISLDVSIFTKLTHLTCDFCLLPSLDLSNNSELTYLNCSHSGLEYLNVSQNTHLKNLYCSHNNLTSLDVSNNTELRELSCTYNELTSLDVSKNTALTYLSCAYNELTSLDLSNNTRLKQLICEWNSLKSLDLSANDKLENIKCNKNELENLVLPTSSAFEELECGSNNLTSLDVSGNTKLETLWCYENQLTSLDVRGCTELKCLGCTGNELTTLDASGLTQLTTLKCGFNRLTSLDVSGDTALNMFYCYGNLLTNLDVSTCASLNDFHCYGNLLTGLDVSACELLDHLNCSSNNMTSLNISNCKNLGRLDCNDNDLSSLDVSQSPYLHDLDCRDNCIGVLDISSNQSLKDYHRKFGLKVEATLYYVAEDTYHDGIRFDVSTKLIPEYVKPLEYSIHGPINDFIERLYLVALGRYPERDGKAYWGMQILKNNKTGGDCAHYFLIEAPEFLNRDLSDDDFVEILYKTFFDRDSEAAGKSFWVDELKKGVKSREDVINSFIDSAEWCNLCASYGINSGASSAKADKASEGAENFATRLYTCCLNREPEDGGLKYWSLALTNLEKTGCEAAAFFFTGDEFVGFGLKNDEYVRRLYTTFMGRDPEASEIAYWVGEIAKGTQTKDSVMQFFGNSEEFTNICKSYGIERGMI